MKKNFVLLMMYTAGLFLLNAAIINGMPSDWTAPEKAKKITNPQVKNEKALTEAQNIFNSQCVTCHGEKGLGNGPAAPYLGVTVANLASDKVQGQSDGEIFWKLTNGNSPMPAFETILSEQDRWKMVILIKNLKH